MFNVAHAFEKLLWLNRLTFFKDGKDVGNQNVLLKLAQSLSLPCDQIENNIADGSAMAALWSDVVLKEKYKLEGSPSYVLNNGRQKLYGNVGYKLIEANVKELLSEPTINATWC